MSNTIENELYDFEVRDEEKIIDPLTIKFYLEDEFFIEIKRYIDDEDYALAKDAVKGLYILAEELKLYKLYINLLDIYEDLDSEDYKELVNHYLEMINEHKRLKEVYANV